MADTMEGKWARCTKRLWLKQIFEVTKGTREVLSHDKECDTILFHNDIWWFGASRRSMKAWGIELWVNIRVSSCKVWLFLSYCISKVLQWVLWRKWGGLDENQVQPISMVKTNKIGRGSTIVNFIGVIECFWIPLHGKVWEWAWGNLLGQVQW